MLRSRWSSAARIDAPGRVSVEELCGQAAELGSSLSPPRGLVALGCRTYVDAVTAVRPDRLRPLDGC